MTFLGQADIPAMLAALKAAGGTVSITVAGATTDGLKRVGDADAFQSEMPGVAAGRESVLVQAGTLPAAAPGVAATVDGQAYKIGSIHAEGDGAMVRLVLRR